MARHVMGWLVGLQWSRRQFKIRISLHRWCHSMCHGRAFKEMSHSKMQMSLHWLTWEAFVGGEPAKKKIDISLQMRTSGIGCPLSSLVRIRWAAIELSSSAGEPLKPPLLMITDYFLQSQGTSMIPCLYQELTACLQHVQKASSIVMQHGPLQLNTQVYSLPVRLAVDQRCETDPCKAIAGCSPPGLHLLQEVLEDVQQAHLALLVLLPQLHHTPTRSLLPGRQACALNSNRGKLFFP